MKQGLFSVIHLTADQTIARFELEGTLVGERTLPKGEVDELARWCEDHYLKHGGVTGGLSLVDLGRRLAEWADGPERWLARALRGNADGFAFHVRGVREPGMLACGPEADAREKCPRGLPWELLHFDGMFACAHPTRPFTPVRFVAPDKIEVEAANRPLRLLFMACSPEDVAPVLEFEREENMILDATRRQSLELVVEESGTIGGLQARVEDYGPGYFDVFHLTGHADVHNNRPVFVMENDFGRHDLVEPEDLARAFAGRWPRLIFLSGCKTGESPQSGLLPSFCEALVAAGAPAVLGWALPVGDAAANLAAEQLYHHLSTGTRLDEAVAYSRHKLLDEGHSDWPLLWLFANATPLTPLVTPLRAKGRAVLQQREARIEFLDAGSKSEVCARQDFVGRRRLLQRSVRILSAPPGGPEYAEGLLLHGMGGLGKSSLAARLCDRMGPHQRLVWVGRLDHTGLYRVLKDRIGTEQINQLLDHENVPLRTKLRACLNGPLLQQPALFVFDDFEQNLELDAEGNAKVLPEPLDILTALAAVIRETASNSRIIVTSRYEFSLPGPAGLRAEMLASMLGPELRKKIGRLDGFKKFLESGDGAERSLGKRARDASAGNPRLIDWINKVLLEPGLDHLAILAALEEKEEEFREQVLLEKLLGFLTPAGRRLLGFLAVFKLPVPREAIEAAVDPIARAELGRVTALGLAECIANPAEGSDYFFISRIVSPLVKQEITDDEKIETARAGVKVLHQKWMLESKTIDLELLLQIHALALISAEAQIAADAAFTISNLLISRDQYREAETICRQALGLGEDFRVLYNLARAEMVLGKIAEARTHYERALKLCPELTEATPPRIRKGYGAILYQLAELSVQLGDINRAMELYDHCGKIYDSLNDVKGKSATLNSVAVVIAQLGDVSRAMSLWEESLKLSDQIGDIQGKSAALHEMAIEIARKGEVSRAMSLLEESLKLSDQIGNVRGKAAALQYMAAMIAQQGDISRAISLWKEALGVSDQIGDVQGKATTLSMMAGVIAEQGEVSRAMSLWEESLKLMEQIGDVKNKAATLSNMAVVLAQQGDIPRAMSLWEESLNLLEQIGNIQGKAAALASMAWGEGKRGNKARAREFNLEAARLLGSVRALMDLVTVLGNLGTGGEPEALAFIAQALWIGLRIAVPLTGSLARHHVLIQKIGPPDPRAPLAASTAMFQVQTRGEKHPQREELQKGAFALLAACAQARKIEPEKFQEWFAGERLNDPGYFLPAFSRALEEMVGEEGWLFDRGAFEPLNPGSAAE